MRGKALFSAPYSFLGQVRADYEAFMPTGFREIWKRDEVTPDPELTVWAPNPGQSFVIDGDVLDMFPKLEVVATPSTGSNHIHRAEGGRRRLAVYSLLGPILKITSNLAWSRGFGFILSLPVLAMVPATAWLVGDTAVHAYRASRPDVSLQVAAALSTASCPA